jgi:hypothetical protein
LIKPVSNVAEGSKARVGHTYGLTWARAERAPFRAPFRVAFRVAFRDTLQPGESIDECQPAGIVSPPAPRGLTPRMHGLAWRLRQVEAFPSRSSSPALAAHPNGVVSVEVDELA